MNQFEFNQLVKNIDKDPQIFNIREPILNIPIWTLFRHTVLTELKRNNYDIGTPHLSIKKDKNFLEKVKKTLYGLTFYNPYIKKGNVDCLFINSQQTNVKLKNKYFNRLHDLIKIHLTKLNFNCLTIDDVINSDLTLPRTENTYLNTVFTFNIKKRILERETIKLFIDSITKIKGVDFSPQQIHKISEEINRNYSLIVHSYYKYYNFFKKNKVKYLFLESAYYGDYNTSIIIAAKSNNIKVIECQHGLVSLNHLAYNFHFDNSFKKDLSKYYPDHFFAYGNYWIRNCNLLNNVISFGYPFLDYSINNNSLFYSYSTPYILICSSSISRDFFIELVNKLYLKFTIIFRPHPSEFKYYQELYNSILNKCTFDITSNIYILIKNAACVYTEFSTILYESIYLKKETVLLLSEYTKISLTKDEIAFFNTLELKNNDIIESKKALDIPNLEFFNPNWESELMSIII